MTNYGSVANPVKLDPFQTIIDVQWGDKTWRVDFTYRVGWRDAQALVGTAYYFSPEDFRMIYFNANTSPESTWDGIQNNGIDILWPVRDGAPEGYWTDEEKALITVSDTSVIRTGYYGYMGSEKHLYEYEYWWIDPEGTSWDEVYEMGETQATVNTPARQGTLVNGTKTFTTKNAQEEENLPATIETWWTQYQAENPDKREFSKGAHYLIT